MAVPEDKVYREFARRGHRLLGAYLALHAWTHDLDGIVVERQEMLEHWGLRKQVKPERLEWLKEDLTPYFLFVKVLHSASGGSFQSIYLSRRPLPPKAFDDTLSTEKRVKLLNSLEAPTAVVKLPSEAEMLAVLSSAIHGLSEFPTD